MQRHQASIKLVKKLNANYNPVAEAESILAEGAFNTPQLAGVGSFVSFLGN